jgi:hypothetical protein
MLDTTAVPGEREKVTAAGWLVMGSVNRKTRVVTMQESTDAAVTDKKHIARSVSSQDVFDLANNAPLRIDRPLPAPNAGVGLREKLIGDRLELVWHQEARRRSIVFMHRFPNFYVDIQFCGNNLGCLNRFPLSAGDDLPCIRKPSCARYCLRARSPDLT